MTATTKRTKSDGEYRVRLFIDGVYQAGGDYFTDDLQDAKETAKAMESNPCETDKTDETAVAEQLDYDADTGTTETVLYDVCNDYSLEEVKGANKSRKIDYNEYTAIKHQCGTVYKHIANNEIHYLKGANGLEGSNIFDVI